MKILTADDEDNKRFASSVARRFIEKCVELGEVPEYIYYYRHCKLINKDKDIYTYAYPITLDQEEHFILHCPEKYVKKALLLHSQINSLQDEFKKFVDKERLEKRDEI